MIRYIQQLAVSLHAIRSTAPGQPDQHISLIMGVDNEGNVWEFNGGKKSWDALPPLPQGPVKGALPIAAPSGVKS